MSSLVSAGWNVENFLSLSGLGLGFLCSVYLLYEWFRHRRTQPHLLLWAVGLALFYIFLTPFIGANFGETIILANWSGFFISAIPLIFFGWALILWGIIKAKSSMTGQKSAKFPLLILFWVLASFVFYSFRFSSVEYQKPLSMIGIAVFFIAIHVFTLFSLWQWFAAGRKQEDARLNVGILFIASAIIVSTVRYLIVLDRLIQLPDVFWFFSIWSLDVVFILRSVVVILLTIGFFLAHKHRFPE